MIFCSTELIQFHLWPQVIVLWEMNADFNELILHPHGMRYLLVYSIFRVADFMGVSYDLIFSLIVPVLVFVTAHYIIKSVSTKLLLSNHNQKVLFFTVFMLLVLLSTLMNGRILFAITGASILLSILMSWKKIAFFKIVIFFLIALILSSVSSGTVFVSIITFVVFVVYQNFNSGRFSWKNISLLCLMMTGTFYIFPLLKVLIMKNVNYFGGGVDGVVNMLGHGVGRVLLKMDLEVLILSLLLLLLVFLINLLLLRYYNKIIIPLLFIVVSTSGGLFGLSTMMMMIPAVMVIACILILKMNKYLTRNIIKVPFP